jgi:ATP-dependent Lon protease
MPIEVLILEGKGSLQVTGQIGEVMMESAQAALSFLKSRCADFDIDSKFLRVWMFIYTFLKAQSQKMDRPPGSHWQPRLFLRLPSIKCVKKSV